MELIAVIEGVKSIPAGREVTIVTDSPHAIPVAYGNHPKLKNPDLILRLRAELSRLKPSFQHV